MPHRSASSAQQRPRLHYRWSHALSQLWKAHGWTLTPRVVTPTDSNRPRPLPTSTPGAHTAVQVEVHPRQQIRPNTTNPMAVRGATPKILHLGGTGVRPSDPAAALCLHQSRRLPLASLVLWRKAAAARETTTLPFPGPVPVLVSVPVPVPVVPVVP